MKGVAFQAGVVGAAENQQAKGQRPGAAGVVDALLGDLDDGDVLLAQRLGEHDGGAGDVGGLVAESGTDPLGLGQPLVEETGRATEEAVAARTLTAVDGLFQNDLVHGSHCRGTRKGAKAQRKKQRSQSLFFFLCAFAPLRELLFLIRWWAGPAS